MVIVRILQGVLGALMLAAIIHAVIALLGYTLLDIGRAALYGGLGLFGVYVGVNADRTEKKEKDAEFFRTQKLVDDTVDWQEKRKRARTAYLTDAEWAELFDEGETLQQRLEVGYREDSKWGIGRDRLQSMHQEVTSDLERMEHARMTGASVAGAKSSSSIEDLARLRQEGLISPEEFKAFSQRFERSPGARAKDVIAAIEQLHQQFRAGAMSEGNYRASLWTLMDKLDREMR